MSMSLSRDLVLRCLTLVLRPTIRFCLRHSLRLQDLIECAKSEFVIQARRELEILNERENASRIAAMTGVHRRDISRLEEPHNIGQYEKDMVTKVMGHWQNDPRFLTKGGQPRSLNVDGGELDFATLVRDVSTDLNAGTVLFELLRVGAVERQGKRVRLVAGSYVPKEDLVAGFTILAKDADDLTHAVEKNILATPKLPHLHARTEYDNVRPSALPQLRQWFLREGHRLHAEAREIISQHDQDINPDEKFSGRGKRVVLGAFSYVEEDD